MSTLRAESPWARTRRRFVRNRVGMSAVAVLVLLTVVAGGFFLLKIGEVPWPADPNATVLKAKLQAPSADHLLGTDNLGRDVFSRILHGTYISLMVGFVAMTVSMSIGVVVGAFSGYAGGKVDALIMRVVDAIMCFPTFFLILTVVALLGPGITNVIIVIGLVSWTGTARLVRAEFLTLRESEYVRAARALGQGNLRIIFGHILPNAVAPIFVSAVLAIPEAILTEAGLSYLGLGVQPPQASWGNIIADGKTYILDAWWLIVFPGVAILVTALAFYLAGEALREAMQTKSSRK